MIPAATFEHQAVIRCLDGQFADGLAGAQRPRVSLHRWESAGSRSRRGIHSGPIERLPAMVAVFSYLATFPPVGSPSYLSTAGDNSTTAWKPTNPITQIGDARSHYFSALPTGIGIPI
jgi:hypothetical protein